MQRWLAAFGAFLAAGCGLIERGTKPYTLYRDSGNPELRLHWASFDADAESESYNRENCELAARLLNENLRRVDPRAYRDHTFWCEPGPYVSHL